MNMPLCFYAHIQQQPIIYGLIIRIQGEFDKANDLIQYVPIEYIKYILEMLTNPYEISYEKLDLI
ncbi:hypothetical protein [Rickettsia helvetica]|uniref:hypothetical protein n=1 Tax=Rickettsia helvetica TaxID=35789 RepID=UPI001E3D14FE|nr:hypothetical protein [Rickettsia helvetica]